MLKPPSLRQHLTTAVPELARDPEKLVVMAKAGRCVTTGTAALAFEYAYTLQLIVLDYAGHADAITVPVLAWLRVNQPELFDNPKLRERALRFDVEYLTDDTIDLAIEMDLTERVLARPREGGPDGALDLIHLPEPEHVGWNRAEHWSLWLREELLAEWDFDPRPVL